MYSLKTFLVKTIDLTSEDETPPLAFGLQESGLHHSILCTTSQYHVFHITTYCVLHHSILCTTSPYTHHPFWDRDNI